MLFRINSVNPTRVATAISAVALSASLAACGSGQSSQSANSSGGQNSQNSGAAKQQGSTAQGGQLSFQESVTLNGAGASFPAPLYQRWFQEIRQPYPNLTVNYQSVGSGAGVKQFTQGTVNFGASDVAMTDEEMQQVERGVILLPMTAGGIVLTYNLPGVEQRLQLPRDVYTNILLGNITNWNDPAIAQANPNANLPDQQITVVHRSDSSGTTGVFTMHLSAISPEWEQQIGQGKTVDWATGVGAKGNEGISAQVNQTQGALGYVEYGYAIQNELQYAALENQAGNFVEPNTQTISNTLEAVELPENLRAFIQDPSGEQSYPIATYTWMLAYEQYPEQTAQAMEGMIQYGLTQGQQYSEQLGYIPLPQSVRERVAQKADQIYQGYNITVTPSQ